MSKQFNKIIDQILIQEHDIECCGMTADRVILGKGVYDILNVVSDYQRPPVEYSSGNIAYAMGLPVTIDYQNKWLIKVCCGLETDVGKLLFPEITD